MEVVKHVIISLFAVLYSCIKKGCLKQRQERICGGECRTQNGGLMLENKNGLKVSPHEEQENISSPINNPINCAFRQQIW